MSKQDTDYCEGKSNDYLVEEMMAEKQRGEEFQRVEYTNIKVAEIYA